MQCPFSISLTPNNLTNVAKQTPPCCCLFCSYSLSMYGDECSLSSDSVHSHDGKQHQNHTGTAVMNSMPAKLMTLATPYSASYQMRLWKKRNWSSHSTGQPKVSVFDDLGMKLNHQLHFIRIDVFKILPSSKAKLYYSNVQQDLMRNPISQCIS